MFLIDLEKGCIIDDAELKAELIKTHPYQQWLDETQIQLRHLPASVSPMAPDDATLLAIQQAFGFTQEDIKFLMMPMAATGQEAIGSMGADNPIAVLSGKPKPLFNYFKQNFAQVTNPAIDPLREELVMSLESYVGQESNLLEEIPGYYSGLKLPHPVLTPQDMNRIHNANHPDLITRDIDILFPANSDGNALKASLDSVFEKSKRAIADGVKLLILTDRKVSDKEAPIPSLLAVSGLNHYLINNGIRPEWSM